MAAFHSPLHHWQRAFFTYGTVVLVIATLYFAQVVIAPVALALLIAFVLAPVVNYLQVHGVPRLLAVLIVVSLATLLLLGLIYFFGAQVDSLMTELPAYRNTIIDKIQTILDAQQGHWRNFFDTMKDIGNTVPGTDPQGTMKVRLEESRFPMVQSVAGAALEFLVNAGAVYLLVIFMLIGGEDLRNRALRLGGRKNLAVTTKAFDEAGQRISQFLAMQFLVNVSYGIILGIGLYFLSVPYALVWGVMATFMRYIPYLGPWIGALFPLATAFAVLPGWQPLLLVAGFILVLELVSNNVMEPVFYGRIVGMSGTAYLVSALFWTWLWGPLGLILSTPLTVCLVVFGRYVASLSIFPVLLGDQPVLPKNVSFFQRLLAKDKVEATQLVTEYCKTKPPSMVFDEIMLPALLQTKRSYQAEEITQEDRRYILTGIRDIVEEGVEPALEATRGEESERQALGPPVTVLGLAWETGGETGLGLLQSMTDPQQYDWTIQSLRRGWKEALARLEEDPPRVVVLGSLATRRPARLRRFCRVLKNRFPDVILLVHAWGQEKPDEFREQMRRAGADGAAVSFFESWRQLTDLDALVDQPTTDQPTTAAAH